MATSSSLTENTHDEVRALNDLTTILGPLPKEWIDSLGAEAHPRIFALFIGLPGTSYSPATPGISLEQRVQSISEVDDTLGLITLLQQILVLDPLQRPEVSDFLHHPWFVGSSSPTTPSGSASE